MMSLYNKQADLWWESGRPLSRMGWDFTDKSIQNLLEPYLKLKLVTEQDVNLKGVLIGLTVTLASLVS